MDICLAMSGFRDLLGSEATAGAEPAMKVLQTSRQFFDPTR